MSVKNFKFVSPGVFVNEIDNSQLPASPAGIGPVIIGRAEKGPSLRPVTVDSFSEFVQIFGTPAPGNASGDVWRRGSWNTTAPTYGAYTAQAYLRNSSPLTYIRLLGSQADEAAGAGIAGWDGGTSGKAWGLCVFEPLSWNDTGHGTGSLEGVLAAIFYTTNASTVLKLSGSIATALTGATGTNRTFSGGNPMTGSNIVVKDDGVAYEFKLLIENADANSITKTSTFNFDINSSKYIRKVFNTTPSRTNSDLVETEENYFLGETFDRHLKANIPETGGQTYASVVEINSSDSDAGVGDDFRTGLQSGQSPAIIGCDLLERGIVANSFDILLQPELFTVHAINEPGDWTNRNIKVSIQDIKVSTNESDPYGSFSVVVRSLRDSDNVVQVIESFTNCNLNPNSLNYVARKVGDTYSQWSNLERRYVQYGEYNNVSKYIRVAVNEDIAGESPALLPFGFRGIIKYKDDSIAGGKDVVNTTAGNWVTGSTQSATANSARPGSGSFASLMTENSGAWTTGSVFIVSGSAFGFGAPGEDPFGGGYDAESNGPWLTASVLYPVPELRLTASDGNLTNKKDAYFGYQTTRTAGGTVFDASNIDLLRPRGGMVSNAFSSDSGYNERSMYFTLDDISGSGIWVSGSHAGGQSVTNTSGAVSGVLDLGFDRFTVPVYGGFDGVDITELAWDRNTAIPSSPTDTNSYIFNSLRQTIDAISDPEVVEMNLAAIPGLKQSGLTTNLINVCEDRADALAVIDLEGGYQPRAEAKVSARNNTSTEIATVINNLRDRALNTSYGCTFFPWVRARDSINGAMVWLPPSVAAVGTFSSSQKKTQVWFAPAGFNRGGLTEGAAGIPIVDVSHQLRKKDRDDLYSANINPIAKFPAEGIVIFGQKTLQVTPSALDRINVRRLMIFVKKRISQVASRLLFDPNVQTTWARFTSAVRPILANIKTNFGLSDFKIVLDETTTTPDLIDRNIMYARIYLKPTRAIEFIAIDFNITRTGASFDD